MRTIVIDPGHGGGDPGNCNGSMIEKDIALDLAVRVGRNLRLLSQGYDNAIRVKTLFTRETDRYVAIDARATLARQAQGDLLLSLHTNSSINSLARGAEIFVSSTGSYKRLSGVIGQEMLTRLESCGMKSRGVKPDKVPFIRFNYLGVLHGVRWSMPALLIEPGFASNTHDADRLRNPNGREVISICIAAAALNGLGIEPRMDRLQR